ncbi:hypothetical protein NC652_016617 [Populus alba x Populus x berolinensis]|nr:hypothetical protein NC652_016617 [Populus alba x Populus x berolinensis]
MDFTYTKNGPTINHFGSKFLLHISLGNILLTTSSQLFFTIIGMICSFW